MTDETNSPQLSDEREGLAVQASWKCGNCNEEWLTFVDGNYKWVECPACGDTRDVPKEILSPSTPQQANQGEEIKKEPNVPSFSVGTSARDFVRLTPGLSEVEPLTQEKISAWIKEEAKKLGLTLTGERESPKTLNALIKKFKTPEMVEAANIYFQERISALEKENAELKEEVLSRPKLIQERDELRAEVERLNVKITMMIGEQSGIVMLEKTALQRLNVFKERCERYENTLRWLHDGLMHFTETKEDQDQAAHLQARIDETLKPAKETT